MQRQNNKTHNIEIEVMHAHQYADDVTVLQAVCGLSLFRTYTCS